MEELYPNYLWQVPVVEDITEWDDFWPTLEVRILDYCKGKRLVNDIWPATTALYKEYNIFTVVDPRIYNLQAEIAGVVNELQPDQQFYIRGWLNVIRDQSTLDWHHHINDVVGGMHGYLSITSEPSITVYRIGEDLLNVKNRHGYAVIGYCNRDQHRTTPMPGDIPRVSVAWDIIPATCKKQRINHWVPL